MDNEKLTVAKVSEKKALNDVQRKNDCVSNLPKWKPVFKLNRRMRMSTETGSITVIAIGVITQSNIN